VIQSEIVKQCMLESIEKAKVAGDWDVLLIHDYLSAHDVFKNGFTDRPTHCDSYGACVDPAALKSAMEEATFPDAWWEKFCEYEETATNRQPAPMICAAWIRRALKDKKPMEKNHADDNHN